MAKVISPLHSAKARGSIAKSLVYFPWKSINAVREWVKPTYTNTGAQQTQRLDFKALVRKWHDGTFEAVDKLAWNVAAKLVKEFPQSGFNRFIGIYRSIFYAIGTLIYLGKFVNTRSFSGYGVHVRIETSGSDATPPAQFFYGMSPTSLIYSEDMLFSGGMWLLDTANAGLGTDVYVFGQCRQYNGDGDLIACSGVYKFQVGSVP